jgi:polysaccharide biosynthesis protein PslH
MFRIRALCFYRSASLRIPLDQALASLRSMAEVEAFPIPQEHSAARLIGDHTNSVITQRAYTAFVYRSAGFTNRLEELLTHTRWDVIHADSLDLSAYFEHLPSVPLVCGHHDVQSELLRRRAQRDHGALRRLYLRLQARLMEQEEHLWCPRVSLNLTVSQEDRETLASRHGGKYAVIPNGVDLQYYRPGSREGSGCLFVGAADWFPNKDAMTFFADEILPRVRKLSPKLSAQWMGQVSPVERDHFTAAGVTVHGHVSDPRPVLEQSACCVVPVRVGGGTRIKILEAWAMGKPVVSTTIGCEGLDARDGSNILIRDDPESFAEAVVNLENNPGLRARIGREARHTVEGQYGWDRISALMIREYTHLLGVQVSRDY